MTRIWKKMKICAAHKLECVDEGHPCAEIHGHNYAITVWCEVPDGKFTLDFKELKTIMDDVIGQYDHRLLNDMITQTHCEYLAMLWYRMMKTKCEYVCQIDVEETDTCGASYAEA
jgi:6-pyruvoyltetrahydropterin/6-carboxytetrahydropterin synthase